MKPATDIPLPPSFQKQPEALVCGLEQVPRRDRQEQGHGGGRHQGEAGGVGGTGIHRRHG